MQLVTAEEMQRIDKTTIEEIGIPGMVLMENAGRAVAEKIMDLVPEPTSQVWIFSGKGNNGGDGFVIARYLSESGYPVRVWLLAEPGGFMGDAAIHLHVIQNLGLCIQHIQDIQELDSLPWEEADLMVDAVFGTGLRGPVRGFAVDVIESINRCSCPVIAVDIPSGLNADTGVAEGSCIHATHTITIGLPKRGLLFSPYVGRWEVVDIGFPDAVVQQQGIQVRLIESKDVRDYLPARPAHAHKGTFGRVLVIAGSAGLTGAAALCSEATLRAGAGLVTLGTPATLNPILETKLTEVMTLPLSETDKGTLSMDAEQVIREFSARVDVLAIGPGLSVHPETAMLIQKLCTTMEKPCVIDADGLNALSQKRELLELLSPQTVLTPHMGEMARLLGTDIAEVRRDPIALVQEFAQKYEITLVLKGAPTVIACADRSVWVNPSGNPGMATAGTGDVLTGMIAGLMAQGLEPKDAAILGVYLHGYAGDIAARKLGMHAMLAGDLLAAIPDAWRDLNDPCALSNM